MEQKVIKIGESILVSNSSQGSIIGIATAGHETNILIPNDSIPEVIAALVDSSGIDIEASKLPSAHQPMDVLPETPLFLLHEHVSTRVVEVHFTESKVYYDIEVTNRSYKGREEYKVLLCGVDSALL